MSNYKLTTTYRKLLADTTTPVSIYLRMRDIFPNTILLESSDYHSRENSMSYVCCDPIAGITLSDQVFSEYFPDGTRHSYPTGEMDIYERVSSFRAKFDYDESPFKFISNGLFGYFTFETVGFFEDIKLRQQENEGRQIPLLQYHIYRYVIAIDHFKNELYLFEHAPETCHPEPVEEERGGLKAAGGLDKISYLIRNKDFPEYKFSLAGDESSNLTDEGFIALVETMKTHIFRGDVFQIVPSRAFSRPFLGDEFNVYRALRSINPSPYLFYFDYGDFKLFGSSPEAQLTISKRKATIYPIAGTFKRTGNDVLDAQLAKQLEQDPKESAEHVMLVDLARNDLSRHCSEVKVEAFKEVQYYSHIIHLVSKVSGTLQPEADPLYVVGDTFPAGTLSGAPKYMAMTLINRYENRQRNFYSGAIGFMGFDGDFNHAIMIRSFLSSRNVLHYQAGAGIVADSDPESELKEVNNKIAALRKALEMAEEL